MVSVIVKMKKRTMETIWWMVIVSVGERRYLLTFSGTTEFNTTWIKYQLWVNDTFSENNWTGEKLHWINLNTACETEVNWSCVVTDLRGRWGCRSWSHRQEHPEDRLRPASAVWFQVWRSAAPLNCCTPKLSGINTQTHQRLYIHRTDIISRSNRVSRTVMQSSDYLCPHFVPWWRPSRCKLVEFWIKGFELIQVFLFLHHRSTWRLFSALVCRHVSSTALLFILSLLILKPTTTFKKKARVCYKIYYNYFSYQTQSKSHFTPAVIWRLHEFNRRYTSDDWTVPRGFTGLQRGDRTDSTVTLRPWETIRTCDRGWWTNREVMVEQSQRREEINSIWRKRGERLGEQRSVTFKSSVTYRQTWQTHPVLQ